MVDTARRSTKKVVLADWHTQRQAGFSLVECLLAMMITMVGVIAVAALFANAVRLQMFARDVTLASALGRAKLEELRLISPTATNSTRAVGGSLTSNVLYHYDQPNTRFTRRWVVAAGPLSTQRITLVVVATQANAFSPTVRFETLVE